jgi:hypothetical protein
MDPVSPMFKFLGWSDTPGSTTLRMVVANGRVTTYTGVYGVVTPTAGSPGALPDFLPSGSDIGNVTFTGGANYDSATGTLVVTGAGSGGFGRQGHFVYTTVATSSAAATARFAISAGGLAGIALRSSLSTFVAGVGRGTNGTTNCTVRKHYGNTWP